MMILSMVELFLQTLYIFKIPVNYIQVLMCYYKNNNNFQ